MTNTYSPSQTKTWLTCPIKRQLRNAGILPRKAGKKELGGVLGTAIAAGAGAYHSMLCHGMVVGPSDVETCQGIAEMVARQNLIALDERGMVFGDGDAAQRANLIPRAIKATGAYIQSQPIPPDWSILAVEFTLPNSGQSRLDLGVRLPDGSPAVVDLKSKLTLDKKYRAKTIAEFDNDWQQLHYCRFFGQYLGEPVERYYIALIVLEPKFDVEFIPYNVKPATMAIHSQSADRVWRQMEAEDRGDEKPWAAAEHSDRYGPCEYQRFCFDYHFDEDLARSVGDYIVPEDTTDA